jgi:DNA modification methylase
MLSIPATGYDVSPETIKTCRLNYQEYADNFIVNDSRRLPAGDNSTELVFTCPPYWLLEKYESVPGQLSDIRNYSDFLTQYELLIKECVRVSKKYVAFVVSNFRHRTVYYDFITDTINLFTAAGVKIFDRIIIDRSHSRPLAARVCLKNHHTRNCHDELLIFK